MTKPTTSLPLTIALQIPTYWTAEQAFAVFQLVDELREAIWQCYSIPDPGPVSRSVPASPRRPHRRPAVLTLKPPCTEKGAPPYGALLSTPSIPPFLSGSSQPLAEQGSCHASENASASPRKLASASLRTPWL